jgi:hypothetical protein
MRKAMLLLAALSLFVLSLVLCDCSRQSEQFKVAEKWVEGETAATSSHDVEKQLSFYTDDLVYEDAALNIRCTPLSRQKININKV